MSHEVHIHPAQSSILRELLFHPQAGYTALQTPTTLSSDHFNFHIARLIELGLVQRVSRGQYRLTIRGKEYANRLDTDNNTVERQPKVAVILAIRRQHHGINEYVFQERLKNPYFGFWGLPSGKIRWGETIVQAAARETLEETGLTADFKIVSVYHEHTLQAENDRLLEDKIFFVALGANPRGTLVESFEGGRNQWLSYDKVTKKDKTYASLKKELDILRDPTWLHEDTVTYSETEF